MRKKDVHERRHPNLNPAYFYCLVFLIAGTVLIGWMFNFSAFKSVLPGLISMKVNTALSFIALASAGISLRKAEKRKAFFWTAIVLSFLTLLLSVITLSEYHFDLNFGIDELFFNDLVAGRRWPPGRFAPITGVSFILISVGILFDRHSQKSVRFIQQAIYGISWLLSFQALVSYLVGTTYSFGSAYYTQIALHTAVSFVLLSSGLLLSRRTEGFMSSIMSPSLAGRVGRRLLLSAILVPPLINWAQLRIVDLGYCAPDFGVLFRVLANVIFFAWIAFRTSENLQKSEAGRALALERLDLIANAIPAFISYVDPDQRYLFANSAYESWFGKLPSEVIDKRIRDILGEAYPAAEETILEALAGKGSRYQNRIIDPQGKLRYFEADYIPDLSPEGQVRGIVIIGHDVTERMQSEERLAQAVKARDELMSICSHELRTPVTSMKLSTQIMLRELQKSDNVEISPTRVKKMVLQAERQLDRLTRLIEEMLDFARLSGGRLILRPEPCHLNEMVLETLERMKPQFEVAGSELIYEEEPGIEGNWDCFRLEQVVTNLLSNALKYASKNPVRVKVFQDENDAVISVKDQGMGISLADQARIFLPYERAVSTSHFGGLGLGLYISSQIVESHGGKLEVESEVGEGATFTIRLPKLPIYP